MLLKQGLNVRNNADPATIYTAVDVEKFFKDLILNNHESNQSSSEKLSAVAAAHRIYTNSLAILPFMIRQKVGDTRNDVNHNLEYVLKIRGNQFMSAYLTKKIIMSQAFWYGTGYGAIIRDGYGKVKEIIPLPSAGRQRYVDEKTGAIWYSFSVSSDNPKRDSLSRKFQESELLVHHFESYDGYIGRGVLDLAAESIKTDSAAQSYGKKFYTNGARVSGIVEVAGELSPDNRDRVREDFERMAHGMDNAFRTAVLDLGMKYTQLGINQKDSQFIESRSFSVEEVSRFTGIPAYMLQTGKQSYQSNEQQQLDFVTNTLMAPVTQIEQEWGYKLLSRIDIQEGLYLMLNMAAFLRGDNKTRAEYYDKMIGLGIYNQDDCRALEDKNPLPDGQGKHFWMSKNYDTIENIVKGGNTNEEGQPKRNSNGQ